MKQKLTLLASLAALEMSLGCGAGDNTEIISSEYELPEPKIQVINGTSAEHYQVSFITALTRGEEGTIPWCTGSLIRPDLVVTAAHCVIGIKPDWIVYGSKNVNEYDPDCLFEIAGTAYHHDYNPWGYAEACNYLAPGDDDKIPTGINTHDIGMILLQEPILNSAPIDILPIDDYDELLPEGKIVRLCGYGTDECDDVGALKCGDVPVRVIYDSDIIFSANYPDGDAGSPGTNPDACFGDSGGPTFVIDSQYLITVTSRLPPGAPQADCGFGYVGASVDFHRGWIEEKSNQLVTQRESRRERALTVSNLEAKADAGHDGVERDGICSLGLPYEEEIEPLVILDKPNCSYSAGKYPLNKNSSLSLGFLVLLYAAGLKRKKHS